jgi:hypothetical protein
MYLAQKEARILAPRPTTGDDDLTKVKQPYEDEHGYVYLQHGDVYRICFRNHSDKNNDVIIEVDGKEIGCWRLKAYQTATIEHPVDDSGKFTFYELGSSEAQKIGLNSISRADLGLVKVTFIPEKPKHHRIPAIDTFPLGAKGIGATKGGDWSESFSSGSHGGGQSVNLNTRSAGGTGLSGKSEQQFGTAGAIDRDYDRQTVINLRLVAKPSNEPRPLRSVNLTVSNPVPPPAN